MPEQLKLHRNAVVILKVLALYAAVARPKDGPTTCDQFWAP